MFSILFIEWCENYNKNVVDIKELQSEIDTYMAKYDEKLAESTKVEKDLVEDEDNDGWKTVTKKYVT